MNSEFKIQSYCHIKSGEFFYNDKLLFKSDAESFSGIMKAAYTNFEIEYPKFFKMDKLSKLAFLGAEILLTKVNPSQPKISDTAVILSNTASSLSTDRVFQESISDSENYYPSPSVFVYTLPNICIGEICIKHQLHSENSFYIFDHFNPNQLWVHSQNLLKTNKAKRVLCGWVDVDGDNYEAFLYLVSEHGTLTHSTKTIKRLYSPQ